MDTKRKRVKICQCLECTNTFLMVGNTTIGMSRPGKVEWDWEKNKPMSGICPAHRRKLSE